MPYGVEVGTLAEQIAWLQEAADGLESPSLGADHDCDGMGAGGISFHVMGKRAMTEGEKAEWTRQLDLERRQRAHMDRMPRG